MTRINAPKIHVLAKAAVAPVLPEPKAVVALPAYQDYTLRAQASAAIVQAKALQVQVAEHVAVHGGCPTNGDGDFGEADSYAGSGLSAVEFGEFEGVTVSWVEPS